jgi:hypothetical protein
MNMMVMLGIVTFFYFFSLTLICFNHDKMLPKFWNWVFIVADIIFFFCWTYAGYQRGWLADGFLTLDNISPLMCTVVPLTCFMSEKVKDHAFAAIAYLNFGMFLAMLISPEQAYLFSFYAEADFLYASEALCHMVCSLFGVYLIVSGQVKISFRYWLKSAVFLYSIITFGVFLNFVFHTSFFGMDPYGGYTIYFLKLFSSFEATLIAYYLGVLVVLTLGMQSGYLLEKLLEKTHRCEPKQENEKGAE